MTSAASSSPAPLFRQEALDHFLEREEGRGVLRVSPPWTWTLLAICLSLLGCALFGATFGRVEITARGLAILRPAGGVRILHSPVGGSVACVDAHSGWKVRQGAPLLRIDAPGVQAQFLEAHRHTESVRGEFHRTALLQDQAFGRQAMSLEARIQRLRAQISSQTASLAHFRRQCTASEALEREGILSASQGGAIRESLAQAQRELNLHEAALEQALQERAFLDGQRQESLWQRRQTIQGAQAREDGLALLLEQTVVRAPHDGVVEALLVRPGEQVQPGQALGKLLPLDTPLQAVAFLAERDRAFLNPGDDALLEMEQLPYGEYGTIRARILRIGEDLASPHERRDALGEDQGLDGQPTFRVELEILEDHAARAARIQLRSGMLARVRFTLRRQRLITLALAPLRKGLR